jgi:signal transduction histidine kinase
VLGLLNLIKLESNEEQKNNFLGLAEKSINKLDTFISDLTHFSRNTRLEIANEPIDFNHIIAECIENLRFMERADRVDARVNIDIEGQFYSDPQRLSIVFQNLISNAIKYQRSDVESYVHITIKGTTTEGVIVVEDNGKGIHEEYLSKIFDMFFRASEESYGSGLGLYITRQVVEKLNGKISVDSTINQGTRFEIRLPNHEPVVLEAEEKEES